MKVSVIIPAFNEEKYLGATLEAVRAALSSIHQSEIIVVDNDSIDRTRSIAVDFGVRVVAEHEHNISKVRNTGADHAAGDLLVFIDADTLVQPGLFEKIIDAMRDDRCPGGSVRVQYSDATRIWVRYYLLVWQFFGRVLKMRQGAAQFCRRNAFRELGGYDTTIFIGEDIEFQWRLAKLARRNGGFTSFIDEPRVHTSARRYEKMGLFKTLIFTHPITILLAWRIRGVWKDWYENAIR